MSATKDTLRLAAAAVAALFVVGAAAEAQTCRNAVQGEIAWGGDANWPADKLDALCAGAENSAEPGGCFARLMSGEVSWGGGTRWVPDNALSLCAGTTDADATISCFEAEIADGAGWRQAIARCETAGSASAAAGINPAVAEAVTQSAGTLPAAGQVMRPASGDDDGVDPGPHVPSEFLGERDIGPVHLIERRFSITLSDCLANLEQAGVGHVWRCDREFDVTPGAFIYNPDAVYRVVYSDLSSDCRVTIKPTTNGIGAQLTHARSASGGPTIREDDARRCMRDAFEAEGIDDRTFGIRLLTTNPG